MKSTVIFRNDNGLLFHVNAYAAYSNMQSILLLTFIYVIFGEVILHVFLH